MCILTGGHLYRVSGTQIFARDLAGGRQALVYSMNISAGADQAMILPLPVPPDPPKDAVRFVDLERSAGFFGALAAGFRRRDEEFTLGAVSAGADLLEVHQVGDYEASFVPSHDDWDRLDPRFRLSEDVWEAMPVYGDYGFAVFQLAVGPKKEEQDELTELLLDAYTHDYAVFNRLYAKHGMDAAEAHRRVEVASVTRTAPCDVHPMAFVFLRRNPEELFFPTVHVHHGRYEEAAEFDHTLYCQHEAPRPIDSIPWRTSNAPVGELLVGAEGVDRDSVAATRLLDLGAPCHRQQRRGEFLNRDVILR